MDLLSLLYGRLARWRRRWYASHPAARRRLARPVISVGSLAVGGSGKTPVVAHLARRLVALGERPAILSRGYARRHRVGEPVVVRDADAIRAPLELAGDEPLMLARALHGVVIVVAPERYRAGRLAEERFGCTVHLLDDGFQHMMLERALDIVLIGREDLHARLLPWGRLREPLEAVRHATAIVAADWTETEAAELQDRLGHPRLFRLARRMGRARPVAPQVLDAGRSQPAGDADIGRSLGPGENGAGPGFSPGDGARVLAVAGIARPERFFADLRQAGWSVVRTLAFRDHHPYSRRDVDRLAREVRTLRADAVLTTEKDLVRLLPYAPLPFSLGWIPLSVEVEPAAEFECWLREALERSRKITEEHGQDGQDGQDGTPSSPSSSVTSVAFRDLP